MTPKHQALLELLRPVIRAAAEDPWDAALARRLNAELPADGEAFRALEALCDEGIESGWMGLQGEPQRKGARVIEPGAETRDFSVDVVQLVDFAGPHHRHPGGEVCAVFAERPEGRFDGHPRGWAVYPPGSDHVPAASGGRVRILFLLPGGRIEYTAAEASLSSGIAGGTAGASR